MQALHWMFSHSLDLIALSVLQSRWNEYIQQVNRVQSVCAYVCVCFEIGNKKINLDAHLSIWNLGLWLKRAGLSVQILTVFHLQFTEYTHVYLITSVRHSPAQHELPI